MRPPSPPLPPVHATIRLSTGGSINLTAEQQERWESEQGADLAAKRGWESEIFRLLGSFTIHTSVTMGGERLGTRLSVRAGTVKTRLANVKWWRGSRLPGAGTVQDEVWDPVSGEVAGQGSLSLAKLLAEVFNGSIFLEDEWALEVLQALASLAQPSEQLWGCPLVRVIIELPPEMAAALESDTGVGKGKGKGKRPREGGASGASGKPAGRCTDRAPLALTAHVYVSRLLLCMVASPSVAVVMRAISRPAGPVLPTSSLPTHPPTLDSHGGAATPPFSLEGLLKSCESPGYRAEPQPAGLSLQLKPYQLQARRGVECE